MPPLAPLLLIAAVATIAANFVWLVSITYASSGRAAALLPLMQFPPWPTLCMRRLPVDLHLLLHLLPSPPLALPLSSPLAPPLALLPLIAAVATTAADIARFDSTANAASGRAAAIQLM